MSLESILKEIKALQPFINEDVNEGPVETLSGRRGRKLQAVQKMEQLTERYTNELTKNMAFIVPVGSGKKEFADTVGTEKFNCFLVSMESFYEDLVDRIPPALYLNKTIDASTFGVMSRHLEDLIMGLNILEYPQIVFRSTYLRMIKDKADMLAVVKQAINEQVGSEIVGLYVAKKIAAEAMRRGFTNVVTPVVLSSEDDGLAMEVYKNLPRLTPNNFIVSFGKTSKTAKQTPGIVVAKNLEDDGVKEVLTTIKNRIKLMK